MLTEGVSVQMAPLKGELAAKRSEGLFPKGPTTYEAV